MCKRDCAPTDEEIARPMVGDDLCSDAQLVTTRSITIAATPADVFPWIRQMGFGKAGWYSYDILDNLGRKSATRIHPEWQNVHDGDDVPSGPISFTAIHVVEPRSFVLCFLRSQGFAHRICFTLAYELVEQHNQTRLVSRVRARIDAPFGSLIAKYLLGPGDGFMVRKQLRTLKERAETRL